MISLFFNVLIPSFQILFSIHWFSGQIHWMSTRSRIFVCPCITNNTFTRLYEEQRICFLYEAGTVYNLWFFVCFCFCFCFFCGVFVAHLFVSFLWFCVQCNIFLRIVHSLIAYRFSLTFIILLVLLFPNTSKLFGFPIYRYWTYLMNGFPERLRAH